MVEIEQRGELQEQLEGLSNDYLKELCFVLGLRRSGPKQQLIDEIKYSEYTYKQDFCSF